MSKTEQDLDTAAVDDALDEALVESIKDYASDDDADDDADDDDADDDGDANDDDPNAEVVTELDDDTELELDDDVRQLAEDDDYEFDDPDDDDDASAAASDDGDGEADGEGEGDDDTTGDESESGELFVDDEFTDDDFDDDDETFEVPKIVMATEVDDDDLDEDSAADADTEAREQPEVSDDILEELRRADVDGPTVEMAPQDDAAAARKKTKRAPDYDPAPVPIPLKVPRILGRKPRVRKVTRVVRHVDPWSVFKIAIVANLVLYAIVMTAGVLLWNVAYATGTVDNVERFFESFGWSSFEFVGGEIYHAAWVAGLFVVLGLTGLAVLLATLFNLITDLVGGVRFTVLEEEVVESRTSPMRRFVVRRPEPEIPAATTDESGSFVREATVDDTGGVAR